MNESQRAAEQTSWDRWVAQALAIAAHPSQPKPRRLALLPGEADDMHEPGPGHPAWRGLDREGT